MHNLQNAALKRALSLIDELAIQQSAGRVDDGYAEIRELLDLLSKLGRGALGVTALERRAFIEASKDAMSKALYCIQAYVNDVEDMLQRSNDDWWSVCVCRSGIEHIRTLYENVISPDYLEYFLDIECFDDLLQGSPKGVVDPLVGCVPEGTPSSHWWWRWGHDD